MLDFLAANWRWIMLVGAFLLMHSRGGGCGMHGSHGHGDHSSHGEHREPQGDQTRQLESARPVGHDHAGQHGTPGERTPHHGHSQAI